MKENLQVMPEHGVRSPYSQAPFKLRMCDYGGVISTGTAFNYLYRDKNFIVTNWHNITGKNFFTRKNLNRDSRTPIWIDIDTGVFVNPANPGSPVRKMSRRVEIYQNPDAQLDPLWLEHPILGSETCDVVALQLDKPAGEPNFLHHFVNKIGDKRIPVRPGGVAVVIGYPRGLEVGWSLPIWKSTFIASEPHYDVNVDGKNLRAFFVDGYTREGMSGSPVFAQFTGNWDLTNPYAPIDPASPDFWDRPDVALGGTAMEFVGVYSGRLQQHEADAALALVWKKDLIDQTCERFFS
jgi:hypothetical protein